MANIPQELRYAKSHEWVHDIKDGTAIIGITDYAQESLGDITYVELPGVGSKFSKGDTFGVVESVKAASDLLIPVSGKITEINPDVDSNPELVNTSPYEQGWLVKIELSNKEEIGGLLSAEDYGKVC